MDEYVVLHVELLFSYTFSFKLNLTIENGSCIMHQGNHMHACMHVQVSWYTYLTAVSIGLGMYSDLGGQFKFAGSVDRFT